MSTTFYILEQQDCADQSGASTKLIVTTAPASDSWFMTMCAL